MCGLFGGRNKDKFLELAKLNAYRGNRSSSVVCINTDDRFEGGENFIISLQKGTDPITEDMVFGDGYFVGHVQAPTTDANAMDSIHPAMLNESMLWHNGIIKDFDVKRLQAKHQTDEKWDTMLLLKELYSLDWLDNLSEINGSFACVYHSENCLYIFRNEISPIFIDDELNFSSVKFDGSRSLPPNTVFMFDGAMKTLQAIGEFKTKENPYFMPEE